MTQLTAHRPHLAPLRALGLSVILVGAVIAAAVLVQQVARTESQAGDVAAAPPVAGFTFRMSHQVAPVEGLNEATAPDFTFRMSHQVAPVEGLNEATAPDFTFKVSHQVAPLAG